MNELIKQLADHARKKQLGNSWSYTSPAEFEQKFAELIVGEMLKTCEEHPGWYGRNIGQQIKLHFGVE